MKRLFGMVVGVLFIGIAYSAFSRAQAGWADGYPDIGFWWTVITVFLTIAALAALVGTWIHTQASKG